MTLSRSSVSSSQGSRLKFRYRLVPGSDTSTFGSPISRWPRISPRRDGFPRAVARAADVDGRPEPIPRDRAACHRPQYVIRDHSHLQAVRSGRNNIRLTIMSARGAREIVMTRAAERLPGFVPRSARYQAPPMLRIWETRLPPEAVASIGLNGLLEPISRSSSAVDSTRPFWANIRMPIEVQSA